MAEVAERVEASGPFDGLRELCCGLRDLCCGLGDLRAVPS